VVEVGIDWAEDHHDVAVLDEQGQLLASRRIPEGVEGLTRLQAVLAEQVEDPAQVMVRVETDRGLLVSALLAAGYRSMRSARERSTATVTATPGWRQVRRW
jgi:Transposase